LIFAFCRATIVAMSTRPDISIITPWLDHTHFIEDYERAVRAPGVEVIVVDNGSAELHAAALRQMIERVGGKYLRNEENHWFSAANNQGLALATGGMVIFLNNDIAADSGWLEQVRADVQPGALHGPSLLSFEIDGKPHFYLEGWCVAGRRDVWDVLGGWDATMHSMPYWEDNDLGYRATAAGFKLLTANWPIRHKGQGTSADVPGVRFGFERVRENFQARVRGQSPPAAAQLPNPKTAGFEGAAALHRGGYLPEAEQAYRIALEREPGRADMWARYGEVLHLSGRHDAAIAALRKAADLQPDNAVFWINLATIAGRSGRFSQSINALNRARELSPQSADVHNNLSRAYFGQKQYEQAAQAAMQALRLRSGFVPAHVNLSNALREMGQHEQALAQAQAAVAANANSVVASNALGAALRALGRLTEALAAYEHSLAVTPHDSIAQRQRAELLALISGKAAG
jgi:tetratricopeptide (TPR) repeat protein